MSSLFNVSFPIISIHALCEEGDVVLSNCFQYIKISIHALCEEGDAAIPEYYWRKLISIHALCEEGDVVVVVVGSVEMLFLSTPSARRATF